MDDRPLPLLIFDGDCAFCTRSAAWIANGWDGSATAVAWQQLGPEGLDRLGLTADQCQKAAWWSEPSGGLFSGHQAIAKGLLAGRGWKRRLGRLILLPGIGPVAAVCYQIIARYRHRLPGGSAACQLPTRP